VVGVAHFRDILDATHRNTLGARTLYSNIYDLKNGLVYLYYLHNFNNEMVDSNCATRFGINFESLCF
jgi:hypothetical protein